MIPNTEVAWPEWVLRFIASDEQEALWDAVWSVGGSPPYGGVSWEEAGAVYALLEGYVGPGMAEESLYRAVRKHVRGDPYRRSVIDLFHVNDQIQSNPDTYTAQMVAQGLGLSKQIDHDGVYGTFLCYQSGLAYRNGDLAGAIEANMQALRLFLQLADEDPVYAKRAAQCANNAVSYLALSGDEEGAWALKRKLDPILEDLDFAEDASQDDGDWMP